MKLTNKSTSVKVEVSDDRGEDLIASGDWESADAPKKPTRGSKRAATVRTD